MSAEEIKKESKQDDKPDIQDHHLKPMSCVKHLFLPSRESEGPSAKCSMCGVGFILSIGMTVNKGHILFHGEEVM